MPKFRLQSVLDLKQRLEDVQQQELAALAQQRRVAEEALLLLAQQASAQQQELATRVRDGHFDIREVTTTLAYIDSVGRSLVVQRDLAAALETRVRASRERLLAIARERHVLERLRERQLAAETAETERREQRAADELVSQRFARKAWEASG